jgi:hypothetical protein
VQNRALVFDAGINRDLQVATGITETSYKSARLKTKGVKSSCVLVKLAVINDTIRGSMQDGDSHSEAPRACVICRRPVVEWILKLTVEDTAGYRHEGLVCPNCGVKLRLSSEKIRDLQIDPWVHEAVARVLRGKDRGEE